MKQRWFEVEGFAESYAKLVEEVILPRALKEDDRKAIRYYKKKLRDYKEYRTSLEKVE